MENTLLQQTIPDFTFIQNMESMDVGHAYVPEKPSVCVAHNLYF